MPRVRITGPGTLYDNGIRRRYAVGAEKTLSADLVRQAVVGGFGEVIADAQPQAGEAPPRHVGAGWYELADGRRVRGRAAAGLV